MSDLQSTYRSALQHDGFIVIPAIISPSSIEALRIACKQAADLARSGSWPHIRTLPKQFPPWSSDISSGIWGVQHLLHPSMPNQQLFASTYFCKPIAEVVTRVIGCSEDDLVMELYNLLVRPDSDFELRWHRDDIPADATKAQEEERLCADLAHGREREYNHAQWNLALYDDESLVVVPGSHARARTEEERNAGPYAKTLRDLKVVKLNPGDAVFYDNNILHRGVYKADKERMTLHGSMSRSGKGEERARNVLQHGTGTWVGECDFGQLESVEKGMGKRAEDMRARLIEMGRNRDDVEYSQPD